MFPVLLQLNGNGGSSRVGEGVQHVIESLPPWPAWVTLLLLLIAAALVIGVYLVERGGYSFQRVAFRLSLAGIRFVLIAIVVFMLYGWMQRPYQTDLPDIVVLVDDSASMSHADHYQEEDRKEYVDRLLADAKWKQGTRINLAKALLLNAQDSLLEQLQAKYNLKIYTAAGSARLQSSGGSGQKSWREILDRLQAEQTVSRLGKSLRDVLEAQRGRPTAAVIFLTDGVTTEGKTVSEAAKYARRKSIPLFIVGVGGEKAPRDVRISDVLADEAVFVGDIVNFDVKVAASGYPGQSVVVRLRRSGDNTDNRPGNAPNKEAVLAKETITLPEVGRTASVQLQHRTSKTGEYEYVVEVAPLEGEVNLDNNQMIRRVAVHDKTIRVLMAQEYPSGDFRYLTNLLGRELIAPAAQTNSQPNPQTSSQSRSQKAIELTTVLQEADKRHAQQDEYARVVFPVSREELFRYDVVIFGDVDPSRLGQAEMQNLADFVIKRGGAVVFIAGPRHTPLAYRNTPLAELMPFNLETASAPHPETPLTQSFQPRLTRLGQSSAHLQLADSLSESLQIWGRFPGVYWFVETPDVKPGARVLAEHPTQSGADGRPLPIISMQYVGAGKVLFHATDDLWRWRFRVGDRFYGRYWIQTIRYLSRSQLLGEGKTVRLATDRNKYRRGDAVNLRITFFDDRQAPVSDAGVTVVLERPGDKKRFIQLHRAGGVRGHFEASVSGLPDGAYRAWLAEPALPGETVSETFVVEAPPGEFARLEMDAADLKAAAKVSQGKFYTFETASKLTKDLPRGREVRVKALPPVSLWNSSLLAAMFVALIALEWILRRKAGLM